MSQSDIPPKRRKNILERYVMGDAEVVNEWFSKKPTILQLPNMIFRAMGTPIFINNPYSGVLIMTGMFVGNWWAGVTGLIGLLSAIITSFGMFQDRGAIINGGATFHGLLIGIVLGATFPNDSAPWIIAMVIVLAALSVPVQSGLGNIAEYLGIPAFNFPFNAVTFFFLAALGRGNPHWPTTAAAADASSSTAVPAFEDVTGLLVQLFADATGTTYEWAQMFLAITTGFSQIYGSDSIIAGCLILCGVIVASPLFLLHGVMAAVISIFAAFAIAAPSAEIAAGVWSYNAILSTMCLGGFFYVPSLLSSFLALLSAFFSVLIHSAMANVVGIAGAPVLAIPFNISAGILVAVSAPGLARVPMDEITYPEDNFRNFGPGSDEVVSEISPV